MKLASLFIASVMAATAVEALVPTMPMHSSRVAQSSKRAFVAVKMAEKMDMGSDFGTAMPEKPEQTLEERLSVAATDFIGNFEGRLKEGVEAPPELETLKKARDDEAGVSELAKCIYELMIESGMLYDEDPEDGSMSPTEFDIKANLEVPEVKAEFAYLYKYGMGLIGQELIDVDTCKSIVKDRLIDRTGLSPEEFDTWLGY
mmetsp:Transcript_422/g.590  ORF Transcript_422/g.590 Transcript_422/m.590 type:complete len:202 (-) Transcript_422:32-637(-)